MGGENNIPKHWEVKQLRDVCKELHSGKRPKGGVQGIESGIPSIGAEHLNYLGGFKFEKIKFVPTEFAQKMVKGVIKKNDIILVKDGATTGKTSFVGNDFPFEFAVINEHVFIVRLAEYILPKFAFYKLYSSKGHKEILEDFRGAAQGGISSGFLDKVNIPIPPLSEQQAIVYKIEELLSDLENGKQQLQTAQQQLKVYRQSLLKWAFEGKLTNKNVKDGELPEGWKWVKIDDVAFSLDNMRKPINKNERLSRIGNIPYYGANGRIGWIDDFIFDEPLVCVVEDETFTGRTIPFSYKITGKTWVNNHAHVLKAKDITNIDFLNYQLSYYPFLRLTTGTTGRKKLTKNALMNAPYKICSLKEQQLIVDQLASKITVCDKIEETITQSLQRVETLKQSILKKAFEGKLV